MLQTTCVSPELLVNQNMSESEICGYSPGQGSPLPGETASPKSCFQQSPSLPDSGLTELNVASPKIYHPPPPCKPPGMPAPADSELSSDPPQKRYMGVRVKMPVRELLRKIRLSKGLEPAHGKEASSVKTVTKGSSGKTAEKRRAHPYTEKQLRQSKQSAGQSPKGLEDLDILVEVLQEDLNKSQLREEPLHPVPDGVWQGFSTDLQSSRWESVGSKEAAGDLQGREHSSAEHHWDSCSRDFLPILEGRQRSSPEIRWDSCSRDFLPILEGRQRSSAGLHSESCLKDFHPILQERQRSSAGLHWNSCSRDFHPMVQERQRRSGELHSESCSRDFHPILQGKQRSSAGLHWDSCLKDFHPILEGRQRSSAELHAESFLKDFHPIPRAEAEPSFQDEQGNTHGSSSPGMFCGTGEEGSSCWMQDALPSSQEGFPRNSPSQEGFPRNSPSQEGFPRNSPSQEGFPRNSPSLSPAEMLLGAPRGSPDPEGHSRLTPIPFPQQDLSALSFFQFQLHREESLLRNIPAEKLLAPDENGNRLLHKAVAQGRRALTFALAQRFASLNKIDEKDAEERTALHLAAEKNQHLMVSDLISLGASVNEQDSSGKTPLHLCAENGYLRVLQVLKNCKDSGVCVEVDVPDHYGLTPLHCAALAHTVLVSESHGTAGDSDEGRFLRLRKEQILEGILCLLQMGAEPELQVLNSCPTSTTCLKLEENTELMCLLQTHKPQGQGVLQESCSLLDAPRGMPGAPAAASLPELCSVASSDLFDVLLKGKC